MGDTEELPSCVLWSRLQKPSRGVLAPAEELSASFSPDVCWPPSGDEREGPSLVDERRCWSVGIGGIFFSPRSSEPTKDLS